MYRSFLQTALFLIAGITIGIMFANFSSPDYRHASLILKEGINPKPIHISDYKGTQVIALSLKNLQQAKDIEARMDGATIQSWYPPVVRMPFLKSVGVAGGRFKGVAFGQRLPLYLTVSGNDFSDNGNKEMEIIDSSTGSVIQTVPVMRGGANGGHH